MTHIEKQMAELQTSARDAINALAAPGAARGAAAPCSAPRRPRSSRFTSISSEIIELSRRNSNVRSLALSLAQKPALVAACDGSLIALEEALAKEGFSATR